MVISIKPMSGPPLWRGRGLDFPHDDWFDRQMFVVDPGEDDWDYVAKIVRKHNEYIRMRLLQESWLD